LHEIPDNISDNAAVMADCVASALHPVIQHFPKDDETILVYGCGVIGLNIILLLRMLGAKSKIIAIYRHAFQGKLAKEFGADHVLKSNANLFKEISKLTNAKLHKPTLGKPVLDGGVNKIFECVGRSNTLDNSLRLLKALGKLVLVATTASVSKVDFSPIWFREIQIVGSFMYYMEQWQGEELSTYTLALRLIQQNPSVFEKMVTHEFKLTDYKKAIEVALDKKNNGCIKAVFDIQGKIQGS
jgi:threonine dehydrogenase-like Zn-dependent dehydrogenase